MHEIDFLPQRYREHATRRIVFAWRAIVVALTAALAVAAFSNQRVEYAALEADVDAARRQHEMVRQKDAAWQALLEDIRDLDAAAEWHTYLRRPWPRSRILAAVVRRAPASVRFRDLRFSHENLTVAPSTVVVANPVKRAADAASVKSARPIERDLKKLREATEQRATVVTLLGTTTDPAALHVYLAELMKDNLLARCELRSIEAGPEPGATRFQLWLLVQPDLGAADGADAAERAVAVATGGTP